MPEEAAPKPEIESKKAGKSTCLNTKIDNFFDPVHKKKPSVWAV